MTDKHTPGPWLLATSNSWRRFVSNSPEHGNASVCEPIKQSDGHPDLFFKNGGEDGPDARLIAAAPDLLEALKDLEAHIRGLRMVQDGFIPKKKVDAARAALRKAEGQS